MFVVRQETFCKCPAGARGVGRKAKFVWRRGVARCGAASIRLFDRAAHAAVRRKATHRLAGALARRRSRATQFRGTRTTATLRHARAVKTRETLRAHETTNLARACVAGALAAWCALAHAADWLPDALTMQGRCGRQPRGDGRRGHALGTGIRRMRKKSEFTAHTELMLNKWRAEKPDFAGDRLLHAGGGAAVLAHAHGPGASPVVPGVRHRPELDGPQVRDAGPAASAPMEFL